ncbi:MAG: HEAT repeat domain-containing protein [Deltaproteobacteria bacterium]|nr:HEAT repeat domain-containing protein [Deltaproteobacteria bacterium]
MENKDRQSSQPGAAEPSRPSLPGAPPTANPEKIALARETLRHLDKVVKTLGLFGARHMNVERAREEFEKVVKDFLGRYGELVLDLDGSKVSCDAALVADGAGQRDDFAFRLFQDGVVQLRLKPGIDRAEIDNLLDVLQMRTGAGTLAHDDTVTLHWDLEPVHAALVVASDFAETMGDKEHAPAGTEDYRRIRVALGERRMTTGAIPPQKPTSDEANRVAQIEALAQPGGGLHFSKAVAAPLREQAIAGDPHLVEKYVEILYRLIVQEPDGEQVERALRVIRQLFVGLMTPAGIDQAIGIVTRFGELAAHDGGRSPHARPAGLVMAQVGDGEMVTKLLAMLTSDGPDAKPMADRVLTLLSLLGDVRGHILDALERVGDPSVRRRLSDLVAADGEKCLELLRTRLSCAGDRLLAEILYMLGRIGTKEAIDVLLDAGSHPRPEVRLKVIEATGDARSDKLKAVLMKALGDENARVRTAALKRLEKGGADPAVAQRLSEIVRGKDFGYADKDEKRRVFLALGSAGGPAMIPFFRECFEQSNPLKRSRIDETRAYAAYMLGVLGDRESRGALEKAARGMLASPLLRSSCSQAIGLLDKAKEG